MPQERLSAVRSEESLRHWMQHLLPQAGACAQVAAWCLVRALLLDFTTNLSQLGRQAGRETTAKIARQFFARWLDRPHWEPDTIYAHLNRRVRRVLARRGCTAVLLDFTYLQHEWAVLQASIGWQRRALPLYRAVIRRQQGEQKGGEAALVRQACEWLAEHLPGSPSRYLLVMDRGMPSHGLIRAVSAGGWRFVFRVRGEWKITHPTFTGQLRDAAAVAGRVGPRPRWLGDVLLGRKGKGKETWSRANVVLYHGLGYQEPWFLVTSERRAARAVAIYRQRMRIECEFRDVKGPWGLDELAAWQDVAAVARFLAWVAVYEWRLASLWLAHRLEKWRPQVQLKGRLSWITITRAWFQDQIRQVALQTPLCC
jgi:Transposase DDE domain